MTATDTKADTAARVLQAVQNLTPVVHDNWAAIDTERTLPKPVRDALFDTGLLNNWLPAWLGGDELDLIHGMEIIEAAARIEPSLGWITMISNANQAFAAWMPKEGAQEVFSPNHTNAAAFIGIDALATPVDGGYQVHGRWPFASGAPHSPWGVGMCPVAGDDTVSPDGSPRTRLFFFAPDDWEMIDTWDGVGLRGTGSHDILVKDAFVPERRSFFLEDAPNTDGVLYQRPFYFTAPPVHAAHAVGAARGIIDAFMALTTGTRTNPHEKIQARPLVHAQLGEAEAILRSVRASIYDNAREGWERTAAGEPTTPEQFGEMMLLVAHTVQSCIQVADLIFNAAGGKGVYTRNRLERFWRDLHVAGQHMTPSLNQYSNVGREMLEAH